MLKCNCNPYLVLYNGLVYGCGTSFAFHWITNSRIFVGKYFIGDISFFFSADKVGTSGVRLNMSDSRRCKIWPKRTRKKKKYCQNLIKHIYNAVMLLKMAIWYSPFFADGTFADDFKIFLEPYFQTATISNATFFH